MNHHGNKQRKSGVTACTTVWQVRLQPPQWPLRWPSATGEGDGPLPKLVENPLSRGGHTQIAGFGAFSKNGGTDTVPLGGACVESLNRYLKSLRNKRKETQKEQR